MSANEGEIKKPQPLEFEPQGKSINDFIETAGERTYRLKKQQQKAKPKNESMTRQRKHFLFINPGTEKINLLRYALRQNKPLPKWCEQGTFARLFELKRNKIFFENMEVLTTEEKRKVVKESYFDPTKPATIEKIFLLYRETYANLSKRNVRDTLKSLEVYQLIHRRRRPPKVLGKMHLTKPGVIAADLFWPKQKEKKVLIGWDETICLCVMDCWSRFSRVYPLERKTKPLILKGLEKFFKDMMSHGHRPRVFLSDKGAEFMNLAESALFKKWKVETFNSPTGTPVHIVESLQSQYMRRAEIFRTAGITENPSHVMHLISGQLNNQPRRQFENKSPLQLLSLSKPQRKEANAFSLEHKPYQETVLPGLPHLLQGQKCRFLTWTRKEQVEGKKKGYFEKWSRSIHTVRKMIRIDKNKDVFKYYLTDMPNYFWRHELLKVGKVDSVVPKLFKIKEKGINEQGDWVEQYEKLKNKPKPKPKKLKYVAPKPKKKKPGYKKLNFNVDESNIIAGPRRRRKPRVNYAE